ncbi:hypothetical protein [Streptomyces sp. NPDC004589]|uniref:hypothetical protein n=1 Tax=Streptomyces sp. NPDC004589 TaxID=3154553 RepID=UPI0033BF6427
MTSPGCHGTPLDPHGGALANEVEGYLLLQAEREQAQREAEALCARLPWLTGGQAEDLARHYTEQRLGLTRQALQATADRAKRLRGEYEARYATLRHALLRRHAVGACLLIACCTTATAGASLFVR